MKTDFETGICVGMLLGGGTETKKPVIQSLTVTENGKYTAPEGVDGYNPVIVNNPYENLWKTEHGDTETIDTGITDDNGNEIVIDGLPIGEDGGGGGGGGMDDANSLIDIEFADGEGSLTFGVSDGVNIIAIEVSVEKSDVYIPKLTVKNLKDGQSKTVSQNALPSEWYMFNPELNFYGAIRFSTSYTPGSGIPYGVELAVNFSDIGITEFDFSTVQWYVMDRSSILGG